jgi:hypothetical protein
MTVTTIIFTSETSFVATWRTLIPQACATSLFGEAKSRKLVRHRFLANRNLASSCDVAFWRIEIPQARATSLFGESNSRKLVLHRFLANRNLASFPYDSF